MNPTDFSTRSEIQDGRQEVFFRKKIRSNNGYNTKVICMSALKLFRKENKSIKINYTDFRPDRKFKMATKGRFSQKNGLNGNGGGGGAGDIVASGGYTLGRSTCRPNFLVFLGIAVTLK